MIRRPPCLHPGVGIHLPYHRRNALIDGVSALHRDVIGACILREGGNLCVQSPPGIVVVVVVVVGLLLAGEVRGVLLNLGAELELRAKLESKS